MGSAILTGHAMEMIPKNDEFEPRARDAFARQGLMSHLGATMAVLRPGYCEIELPMRPQLGQQHGYLHGGAMASIADAAAGFAAFSLMAADEQPLSVEYKLNILRPGIGERFVARARVVKSGRTLTVVSADVFALGGAESHILTSIQTIIALAGRRDDEQRLVPPLG